MTEHEARSMMYLKIPVNIFFPSNCECIRWERQVFTNAKDFFKQVKHLGSIHSTTQILNGTLLTQLQNGRTITATNASVLTSCEEELASLHQFISILHADYLLKHGYSFPPTQKLDNRDRSILNTRIRVFQAQPLICNANLETTNSRIELVSDNDVRSSEGLPFWPWSITMEQDDAGNLQGTNCVCSTFVFEIKVSLRDCCVTHNRFSDSLHSNFSPSHGLELSSRIPFNNFLLLAEKIKALRVDITGMNTTFRDVFEKISSSEREKASCIHYNSQLLQEFRQVGPRLRNQHVNNINKVLSLIDTPADNISDTLQTVCRILPIPLFRHQQQALQQMLNMESRDLEDLFFMDLPCTRHRFSPQLNYFKILKDHPMQPINFSGGFLCDHTGLGKTLTCLSLAMITAAKGPTLVVTTLSILAHWKSELSKLSGASLANVSVCEDNTENAFCFHTYYGQSRQRNPDILARNTVVLTTYNTLNRDYYDSQHTQLVRRKTYPLHDIDFYRVICDESHKINTANCAVISALKKKVVWCVSATPLGDGTECDAMRMQLGLFNPGFGTTPTTWKHIMETEGQASTSYLNPSNIVVPHRLVSILKRVCVRNTEETIEQTLLPQIRTTTLECRPPSNYREVSQTTTQLIQRDSRNGIRAQKHFNALRRYLTSSNTEIPRQQLPPLIEEQNVQLPDDICAICLEEFETPVMLPCRHFCCFSCVQQIQVVGRTTQKKCPHCRQLFHQNELRLIEPYESTEPTNQVSGKISVLKTFLEQSAHQKILVFTEFKTNYLMVSQICTELNRGLYSLDGSMTSSKRAKYIKEFDEKNEKLVFFLTSRTSSTGINLQSASCIVFLEPFLLKSTQKQAIGRIQRIGQKAREVEVVHLITTNTFEQNLKNTTENWRPSVQNILDVLL